MPGIAYYCGSKFALEGISEVLGKEMKPFGIAVTAVAPGSFRTDWAGRSMARITPLHLRLRRPCLIRSEEAREEKSGKQLGDPAKAARAMLTAIYSDSPPAHLLLGSDALSLVRQKLAESHRRDQSVGNNDALHRWLNERSRETLSFETEAQCFQKCVTSASSGRSRMRTSLPTITRANRALNPQAKSGRDWRRHWGPNDPSSSSRGCGRRSSPGRTT